MILSSRPTQNRFHGSLSEESQQSGSSGTDQAGTRRFETGKSKTLPSRLHEGAPRERDLGAPGFYGRRPAGATAARGTPSSSGWGTPAALSDSHLLESSDQQVVDIESDGGRRLDVSAAVGLRRRMTLWKNHHGDLWVNSDRKQSIEISVLLTYYTA